MNQEQNMVNCYCDVCRGFVCKYELDFSQTGAIRLEMDFPGTEEIRIIDVVTKQEIITRNETHDNKEVIICNSCAKKISIKLIEENC